MSSPPTPNPQTFSLVVSDWYSKLWKGAHFSSYQRIVLPFCTPSLIFLAVLWKSFWRKTQLGLTDLNSSGTCTNFSCWLLMDVYPIRIPEQCAQLSVEGHWDPVQIPERGHLFWSSQETLPLKKWLAGRERGDLALMKYCPLLLWPVVTEDTCWFQSKPLSSYPCTSCGHNEICSSCVCGDILAMALWLGSRGSQAHTVSVMLSGDVMGL